MRKVQKDFIGLWVNAGGWLARPTKNSQFKTGDMVKTYHFGGSTRAGVGKSVSCKRGQYLENWITTGVVVIQLPKLKKMLNQKDLEKYMRNSWNFYQDKHFDKDLLIEWSEITRKAW